MGKLICPSPYISHINVIFFRVLVIVGNTLTGFQTFFGKMVIPFYLFRPWPRFVYLWAYFIYYFGIIAAKCLGRKRGCPNNIRSLPLPKGFPLPFDDIVWPLSWFSDGPRPRPLLPCLPCSLEWSSEIRTHRWKYKKDRF